MTGFTRRDVLKLGATAGLAALGWQGGRLRAAEDFVSRRPAPGARTFTSPAVEAELARVGARIGDRELAWLFANCYPNTLDTTVSLGRLDGKPDTFIVTGDIDALWLRDSSAQVWPYLALARGDAALTRLYRGLIHRHARCVLIDPYANAFLHDPAATTPLSWAVHDHTDMRSGVAERKWEVDSLCHVVRLAHGYWQASGDAQPFDADWRQAMRRVVATLRAQQRLHGRGPYRFQRDSANPADSQSNDGYGAPARPVGMIHSMFRPSDDACLLPLLVPSNLFAVQSLRQLASMAVALFADREFARECTALAGEVQAALLRHAVAHDGADTFWAYEVDGYGGAVCMDDANVPSLLGLPYLGCCTVDDALYRRTRARILSAANPYFASGTAADGIGSPHTGRGTIWPMALVVRALTTHDAAEIRQNLHWLKTTHAGTGFMHEAFDADDARRFTRPWFAWANSLFGELVARLARHQPALLRPF
ncbi:MAG TPA: glycoside hydrolase family 125 protein [Rhodanobacteraceae bacterium]|nr:glycoside hydrolase family 125 protein [Rhodanobacteraceae bacterium]